MKKRAYFSLNGISEILFKKRVLLLFAFIFAFMLFSIFIPFMKENNLYSWDGSGQVAAIEYFDSNCFPKFVCWNQNYFLGYPQGQFYPQGLYWLASLLHKISYIPLIFCVKLLLMLSMFLFPISVYYFLKKLRVEKDLNLILTASAVILLFITDAYPGGNIKGLLDIGLYAHFFAMPFLFFYMSFIKEYFEGKISFIKPTIFMSFLILIHIIAALIASLVFLSALIYVSIIKKAPIKKAFVHFLFVVLLTSFWVMPFILKISYFSSIKITGEYILSPIYLFFFSLFAVSFMFKNQKNDAPPRLESRGFQRSRHKKEQAYIPLMLLLIFSISFISSCFSLPLHTYRLATIVYILSIFCVFLILYNLNNTISSVTLVLVILFLFGSLAMELPNIHAKGVYNQEIPSLEKLQNSRYYINIPPSAETSPHYLQSMMPQRSDILSLRGLFIEGSKNSKFILMLDHVSNSENLIWSYNLPDEINSIEQESFFKKSYSIFGVSKIFTIKESGNSMEHKTNYYKDSDEKGFSDYDYDINDVEDNAIIESIDYIPQKLETSPEKWFYEQSDLIYKSYEKIPEMNFEKGGKISNVKIEKNKISFSADKFSPILVKISYYPNWKAYDIKGKEIKIYEVTPSIMLLFAEGDVAIKYKTLAYERLFDALSFLALIILVICFIRELKSKKYSFFH